MLLVRLGIIQHAAKEALKKLPDSQSKLALEALVDFVVDRKN